MAATAVSVERRRIALVSVVRLGVLSALLVALGASFSRGKVPGSSTFTGDLATLTLAVAFALSIAYAAILRRGIPRWLPYLQLVVDQITWGVVVYLTGGASSGATSLYGLTCVAGSVLAGPRGAIVAAGAAEASLLTVALGLQTGLLPAPPDQPARIYVLPPQELFYQLAVSTVALALVSLLGGWLAHRLRSTGGLLRDAEARAERAERMAALGRLAAGLAHEIRNPLGAIQGSVAILRMSPALAGADRQLCEIIEREVARLNDLVTDMMDLARPRQPQPMALDLATLARDVVTLAGQSGRGGTDVAVVYDGAETATTEADPAQMRQLLWNLVRNAVQASEPGSTVFVHLTQQGEDGWELAVEDQGRGIDAEAQARLFDAFFTTRSEGSGLGLAVVKRIVDDHRFQISVDSEAGRGAVFRVAIPVRRVPTLVPPSVGF